MRLNDFYSNPMYRSICITRDKKIYAQCKRPISSGRGTREPVNTIIQSPRGLDGRLVILFVRVAILTSTSLSLCSTTLSLSLESREKETYPTSGLWRHLSTSGLPPHLVRNDAYISSCLPLYLTVRCKLGQHLIKSGQQIDYIHCRKVEDS